LTSWREKIFGLSSSILGAWLGQFRAEVKDVQIAMVGEKPMALFAGRL